MQCRSQCILFTRTHCCQIVAYLVYWRAIISCVWASCKNEVSFPWILSIFIHGFLIDLSLADVIVLLLSAGGFWFGQKDLKCCIASIVITCLRCDILYLTFRRYLKISRYFLLLFRDKIVKRSCTTQTNAGHEL